MNWVIQTAPRPPGLEGASVWRTVCVAVVLLNTAVVPAHANGGSGPGAWLLLGVDGGVAAVVIATAWCSRRTRSAERGQR